MKKELINLDGKTYTILMQCKVKEGYEQLIVETANKDGLKVAREALVLQEVFDIAKNQYHLSSFGNYMVTATTNTGLTIVGRLKDLPNCFVYEDIVYRNGEYVMHIALNETMFVHMYQEWKKGIQDLKSAIKLMDDEPNLWELSQGE